MVRPAESRLVQPPEMLGDRGVIRGFPQVLAHSRDDLMHYAGAAIIQATLAAQVPGVPCCLRRAARPCAHGTPLAPAIRCSATVCRLSSAREQVTCAQSL